MFLTSSSILDLKNCDKIRRKELLFSLVTKLFQYKVCFLGQVKVLLSYCYSVYIYCMGLFSFKIPRLLTILKVVTVRPCNDHWNCIDSIFYGKTTSTRTSVRLSYF